mgnify:CR=1 FL=1
MIKTEPLNCELQLTVGHRRDFDLVTVTPARTGHDLLKKPQVEASLEHFELTAERWLTDSQMLRGCIDAA